jgi:hypothetical protein
MSAKEYKKLIVLKSAETLRLAGFKKQGVHFSRSVNDVVHLLSFQSSTESTSTTVKMTVNVGIWLNALVEDWQKPDIWSSHWRQRIGQLMPEHNDRWWTVSSEHEAKIAASEIDKAVKKYVLPEFENLSNRDALVKLWQAGVSPGLTKLLATRYLDRLNQKSG